MNTSWVRTELVRAIVFSIVWIVAFYVARQQFAWEGGVLASLTWFIIAAVYYTISTAQPVRPLLLSLVAALIFFAVWMGGVLYTGGDAANGALIGIIVAAAFGSAYYLFTYIFPARSS